MDTEKIVWILKENIALVLNQEPCSIDQNMPFIKLGISSIASLTIINKIKRILQIDINPVAMFEYKTIIDLATYLNQCIQDEAA